MAAPSILPDAAHAAEAPVMGDASPVWADATSPDMAGLDPAISSSTVPRLLAGSSPAMTMRGPRPNWFAPMTSNVACWPKSSA